MSSGYSSLEEDSEEYFFTARTSFFKKPSGKVIVNKVTIIYWHAYCQDNTSVSCLFLVESIVRVSHLEGGVIQNFIHKYVNFILLCLLAKANM